MLTGPVCQWLWVNSLKASCFHFTFLVPASFSRSPEETKVSSVVSNTSQSSHCHLFSLPPVPSSTFWFLQTLDPFPLTHQSQSGQITPSPTDRSTIIQDFRWFNHLRHSCNVVDCKLRETRNLFRNNMYPKIYKRECKS